MAKQSAQPHHLAGPDANASKKGVVVGREAKVSKQQTLRQNRVDANAISRLLEHDVDVVKMVRKPPTTIFSKDAPSRNLRFPDYGNFTVVELCTFLPNWLRSTDVLYRLFENGFDTQTLRKIINYHRDSPKDQELTNNTLCHLFQKTMREFGYTKWNVRKHRAGEYKKTQAWDADKMSLKDLKVQCEYFPGQFGNSHLALDNVDFKSLAAGVKNFPSNTNGDALDLTSCVQYALQHPYMDLKFPRDFEAISTHLGGPSTVLLQHLDREVYARWTTAPKTVVSVIKRTAAREKTTDASREGGKGRKSAQSRHYTRAKAYKKAETVLRTSLRDRKSQESGSTQKIKYQALSQAISYQELKNSVGSPWAPPSTQRAAGFQHPTMLNRAPFGILKSIGHTAPHDEEKSSGSSIPSYGGYNPHSSLAAFEDVYATMDTYAQQRLLFGLSNSGSFHNMIPNTNQFSVIYGPITPSLDGFVAPGPLDPDKQGRETVKSAAHVTESYDVEEIDLSELYWTSREFLAQIDERIEVLAKLERQAALVSSVLPNQQS